MTEHGLPKLPIIKQNVLNILTLNVCGLKSFGSIDQVRNLLLKYQISVAVLTETEVSHEIAKTFNIEGFTVFCPPPFTTGPRGKEAGLIILVSNEIATCTFARSDIKKEDSIPSIWIHLKNLNQNLDCIIGGVYRRSRASVDLMKSEFCQLQQQILCAAQTGKTVLVLGDINVDHNNLLHAMAKEGNDLLAILETADMRHLPNNAPTWRSYGLHKLCKCSDRSCTCPKLQRTSCIDNAYVSPETNTSLKVLDEAVTDHYPLLVKLENKPIIRKNKLKSVWRRDTSKINAYEFEAKLGLQDWSRIYDTNDPSIILQIILANINSALDLISPLKEMKFRENQPKLNLCKDTLIALDIRNKARKSGNKDLYKRMRNKVTKMVKRDQIQSVMTRLGRNPSQKNAWQEAKLYLGVGRDSALPECTTNNNPKFTAEHQNQYFTDKIEKLVSSIPTTNNASVSPNTSMSTSASCPRSRQALHPWPSDLKASPKIPPDTPPKTPPVDKKFEFKFINASDVTRIISNLKNTKALGVDKVATEVLKKGVITLAGPVARLCKVSMATGIVPDLFKNAIVHPVYKGHGKDPRDPGFYRPVAILPALSKVLETAVHDALHSWFKKTGFLPENQYGFQPGRSVAMALAVHCK